MSTVIVTVVITLGIIIAGGFLIYFLGDLFMSLASHGKKDDEAIKGKNQRDKEKIKTVLAEKYPEDAEKIENDSDYAAVVLSGGKVEAYDPNEDKKEEAEPETDEEIEVEQPTQPEEEPATEEVEETVEDDQAERERIEKRRQEILDRINRLSQEMQEEPEEAETEEVDLTEEDSAEESEEQAEEEPATEEAKEAAAEVVEEDVIGYSKEELEEMLASEREELKANEKELRNCKKEFIPLRRVKKTLERDEKKLRRKEALVAKQKVELYGVNNIADIDEEKAKKLSEDLDLYDGLKLSVQHCQEVMEKNAERYPLLEQIFNLLTSRNNELKANIASYEKMLAKLDGTDAGEGEE